MPNKIDHLKMVLQNECFDIGCICETKLDLNILDGEIALRNFELYRSDRTLGKGGGSCIYVNNSINACRISDFDFDDCRAIKLQIENCIIVVILIYRSPSLSIARSMELIEMLNSFVSLIPNDQIIMITGDLNLPNVNWTEGIVHAPQNSQNAFLNMQACFVNTFRLNNLEWCVDDSVFTRVKSVGGETQRATLDQILLSDINLLQGFKILPPLGKSDHVGLLASLNTVTDKRLVKNSIRLWGKIKVSDIISYGNSINWTAATDNPEKMWNNIYSHLMEITNTVPQKILSDCQYKCSSTVNRAYNACKTAWSRATKFPTASNYSVAKAATENLNNKMHQYQQSKERTAVSCLKDNPKVFFSYMAEKKQVRNRISCLKNESGTNTNDPEEMSNLLGAFFESTFVAEPPGDIPALQPARVNHLISDLTIDDEEVKSALGRLNLSKSHGPDNVHPKLLKSLSECPSFVKTLTELFQKCYDQGIFPNDWKSAIVTALHKKRRQNEPKKLQANQSDLYCRQML